VLIVGGAFSVLQSTQAIDAMIRSVARAHAGSALARAGLIPLNVTLFSLGGATFGMSEEAIPFVGSQVGFAAAFLNPFNVGIAQGIAGVPVFSGMGYRLLVWALATGLTIGFLMWYAARIRRDPQASPTWAQDQERRREGMDRMAGPAELTRTHRAVLWLFLATLAGMVLGVVGYGWFVEEIAALFLAMAIAVALLARLDGERFVAAFLQGARDLVGTALVIALARGTMILARDAQIIDTMLHALAPLIDSSSPVFAAQKMFAIQTVINFFIHSGSGQAALTMPIMAPLADLVGVSRQTAILAFQLGELSTPLIPTSGITVGVLALARIPWLAWARWMIPLQLIYLALALLALAPPCLMGW
jgi:uncharacterized ion transporter superfamily protein YfcC